MVLGKAPGLASGACRFITHICQQPQAKAAQPLPTGHVASSTLRSCPHAHLGKYQMSHTNFFRSCCPSLSNFPQNI